MVGRGLPLQEVRERYAEEAFLVSPHHGEKEKKEKNMSALTTSTKARGIA
jgi:hypothetical protein